jgi:hypothetical protein
MENCPILDVQAKVLNRVAYLAHGKARLASVLLVDPEELDRWMKGLVEVPEDVFALTLALLRGLERRKDAH